ncbi:MAG: hypothetical protein JWQ53_412, partial [Klenkia sp.]|nr:hypothetical protein [Klenkia sp.]
MRDGTPGTTLPVPVDPEALLELEDAVVEAGTPVRARRAPPTGETPAGPLTPGRGTRSADVHGRAAGP